MDFLFILVAEKLQTLIHPINNNALDDSLGISNINRLNVSRQWIQ